MSFYMLLGGNGDYESVDVERQRDGSLWIGAATTEGTQYVAIPAERVDEFIAGLTKEAGR